MEEKELKIYVSLLSLGSIATLGQISMLSGYDILITNASLESLANKGFIMQHKGKISRYYALEPFLETYIKLFDPMSYLTLIRKLSKGLENSSLSLIDDSAMFNQYLKSKLDEKKKEIQKSINLSPDQVNSTETILNSSIEIIANTAFSIIQDMEEKGKKILQKTSKSFQNETNIIFQSITDTRDSLINLYKISRENSIPSTFLHDVLVGESSILIYFRDLVTRAKSSLLIFMPIPEIKTLMSLIEMSQRIALKIDIIGNINKTPSVILDKVKNDGIDIHLRQLEEIDFWCIVMDDEEMLFAPNSKKEQDEQITGVFTTYKPLISQFSETLRKFLLRASPL